MHLRMVLTLCRAASSCFMRACGPAGPVKCSSLRRMSAAASLTRANSALTASKRASSALWSLEASANSQVMDGDMYHGSQFSMMQGLGCFHTQPELNSTRIADVW
eukprot:GHUV01038610.1.p1 GENE.GHUV01038610.1~~GHUV01038610.1.p1  ORF type:complete len:105 (+),score=24.09 GHUV01038610.1:472-786(+)